MIKDLLKKYNLFYWGGLIVLLAVCVVYAGKCVSEASQGFDPFRKMYILLTVVLILVLLLAGFLLLFRKTALETVFLPVILVLGISYSLIIPVQAAPDEGLRIDSALSYAGNLMGWGTGEKDTMRLRKIEAEPELLSTGIDHAYYNTYFSRLKEAEASALTTEKGFSYTTEVPQAVYGIPALGILLGRLLHLGVVPTMLLGRLFNLLFFAACGFYAIRRTPFGKPLFFMISLLPIFMQAVSTFSIDCVPLGLTFVSVAGILRYSFLQKSITEEFKEHRLVVLLELILIGAATFFLARCKYGALLPVCMLLFLPLTEKGKKDRILCIGSLSLFALDFAAGFLPQIIATFSGEVLKGGGVPHYTVSDIFSHPLHTFTVLGNTINRYMDHYFYSTIGTSLGWFELNIPSAVGLLFVILLAVAVLSQKRVKYNFTKASKGLIGLCALLGLMFAVAGMMLGNTPVTSEIIEGVQGRYFLPFLLPLLLIPGSGILRVSDTEDFYRKTILTELVCTLMVFQCLFIRAY